MASNKYIPEFPYKGDQAIISSGRILFHAKDDSAFIFGKKAVSISSVGVVNIDNYEGTTINSPKIELGLDAKNSGEPLMLGITTNKLIQDILDDLSNLADALSGLSSSRLEAASVLIRKASRRMKRKAKQYNQDLNTNYNLSNISYTK